MKHWLITPAIALSILLFSCNNKDRSITLIDHDGSNLMIMNLQGVRDSIKINLTDLAADLRFIRLETRPECLISNAAYYITDRYILAKTKTSIIQFDNHGKFVRILAYQGKGPREFSVAEWVVDEKNDQLILADEQKTNYFLSFDLKTGDYLGDIPKAVQGVTRKFSLTDTGTLACVPYISAGSQPEQYYLYWQDLKGNLIDTVKAPADLAIFRGLYLEPISDGYRYMLAHSNKDTIYTLSKKSLIPYLAFNYGEEVPENMEDLGYRYMSIALETSRYLFLYKDQITEIRGTGDNPSPVYTENNYMVDKKLNKALLLSGINNDFTGAQQWVRRFKVLPNKLIYTSLQALELLGMAERAIENPKSDQKLIGRMKEIRDLVSREDNPVLLVGRII